jgi:hypothetical protein
MVVGPRLQLVTSPGGFPHERHHRYELPDTSAAPRLDLFASHSAVPIGSVTRPVAKGRTGPERVVQAPSLS